MPIWVNCSLVMSRSGSSMNNCFSENMCSRVFKCARSSAGVPQRTLHNSHIRVCGCVDLKERGKIERRRRGNGRKKERGEKEGERDKQAYLDAFLCNSFIFSLRRRTRVVRCWSIRSPETATPVCRGYIGVGSFSISFEESRTSSGETWFQPRFVDWNEGTDSRCFRMRLCKIVEGVTIERLSETGKQTYSRSFCLALAWMVRIVCSPHCATSSSTAPMAQLIARRTWLICAEKKVSDHICV